jgi:ADP-dependent NAD(P)H-hydrate dehydratase / NAD(P)H-hydrate epimerase
MDTLPTVPPAQRLVSVAEMQAIEKATDAGGHSYAAMMERAGRAVAETILVRYGRQAASKQAASKQAASKQAASKQAASKQAVLVLAGPGNNGGDGLVCARYLHEAGTTVFVYLWKRRTDPEHDYEGHFARLADLGVAAARAEEDGGLATLRAWLAQSGVVVDALLGTGANRPIDGLLAELLDTIAAEQVDGQRFVAVDCASGLDCDTGALSSHALIPHVTVTFGFPKLGHYQFPGAEAVGELLVVDIGIADTAIEGLRTFLITPELVQSWMPQRPRLSHKGTFGKVLLAVGSESFPGAAYLSCAAAGRSGAGLVTGAVPRPVWPLVAGRLAEPTWLPLPVYPDKQSSGAVEVQPGEDPADEEPAGSLVPSAGETVAASAASYTALVLGCGLGNNKATRRFVDQLLRHPLPATVIDADGLNCMAGLPDWPARLPAKCVLTPHPAEMARLCQVEVGEVVARRWELARARAAEWRCVILLKGPYTVVAHPDGWLGVLPIATPALATAGSGDVLAGTIGGLLAQGVEPLAAACVAAWLHGSAGLACEREIGPAGVVASDLLVHLPVLLRELHGGVSRDAPSTT